MSCPNFPPLPYRTTFMIVISIKSSDYIQILCSVTITFYPSHGLFKFPQWDHSWISLGSPVLPYLFPLAPFCLSFSLCFQNKYNGLSLQYSLAKTLSYLVPLSIPYLWQNFWKKLNIHFFHIFLMLSLHLLHIFFIVSLYLLHAHAPEFK